MKNYESRSPSRLWTEGLLGEAIAMPRLVLPRPSTRVCIFAQGRSGTTLLVTSLDSHPRIRCADEVLRRPRLRPMPYLDAVSRGSFPVFGFHLKPDHLTRHQRMTVDEVGQVVGRMHAAGWRFIHLVRRDLVGAAFSVEYAKIHGWHHRTDRSRDAARPLQIDPERFVVRVRERQDWHACERAALTGIEHFPLIYEDDLLDPDIRAERLGALQDWLGVARHSLSSPLRKSVPRPPWEMMANPGDVRAALEAAGLAPA